MNRIIPEEKNTESRTPKWLKADEVIQAAGADQEAIRKEAASVPKSATTSEEFVVRFACQGCHKDIFPSHTEIVKQAQTALNVGITTPDFTCPHCGDKLVVGETSRRIIPVPTTRSSHQAVAFAARMVDLQGRETNKYLVPDYVPNSTIDQRIVHKAMHELSKHVRKVGMVDARIRFQRAVRTSNGPHPDAIRTAEYLVDYLDSAGVRNAITAEVSITPQGQILLPRSFRTVEGHEMMFTKDAVEALAEGRSYDKPVPDLYQKSMEPDIRPEDITRWRAAEDDRMSKVSGDAIIEIDHEGEEATVTVKDEGGFEFSTGTPSDDEDVFEEEEDIFGVDPFEEMEPLEGEEEDVEDIFEEDEEGEEDIFEEDEEGEEDKEEDEEDEEVEAAVDVRLQKTSLLDPFGLQPGEQIYDNTADDLMTIQEQQPEGITVDLPGDYAGEPVFIPIEQLQTPTMMPVASKEAARDEGTGVPTMDTDTVEVGMTEFPDYTKSMAEATQEILADRPEWTNRGRMFHRDRTRYELESAGDSQRVKGDPDIKEKVSEPAGEEERLTFSSVDWEDMEVEAKCKSAPKSKLKRCVEDVKKDSDVDNPWAVCKDAVE